MKNAHLCVTLCLFLSLIPGTAREKGGVQSTGMTIPLPPLVNGGLSSLWYDDHKFISNEYGDFELVNYTTAGFTNKKDSLTARSWTPVAMGDFVTKELSYATLAQLKNNADGLLLIMFQWHDPKDTTRENGVYFRSFINRKKLLLRTRQSTTGGVDTLEISCGNTEKPCGKCYFDTKKGSMVLTMGPDK